MHTLVLCYKNGILLTTIVTWSEYFPFTLQFVRITLDDFEVGVPDICEEDYLSVYEGEDDADNLPKYTLCGVQSGTFVLKSNVTTLSFKSGEGEGGRGFNLTYETFPMGKHSLDYHQINQSSDPERCKHICIGRIDLVYHNFW